MRFFYKREKGSITVFLVLILIPSIFFVGFLDDLARMRFYNNQAVMAADNYGQAILSEYDNLLKELYGFFAVTQNEEALDALDNLKGYMTTSFNPGANVIAMDFASTSELANMTGLYRDYVGYMPYLNANVTMDYSFDGLNSDLGNTDIFASQLGDFMRFRIVQQFIDQSGNFTEDDLLATFDAVKESAANNEVSAAKADCEEPVEEFMTAVQEYYNVLSIIVAYSDYMCGAYDAYESIADNSSSSSFKGAKREMMNIADSEEYKDYIYIYYTNTEDIEDIDEEIQEEIDSISENKPAKDGTSTFYALDDDDQRRMLAYWNGNLEDELNGKFEEVIRAYADACKIDYDAGSYKMMTYSMTDSSGKPNTNCISVTTFATAFDDLKAKAENIKTKTAAVEEKINILQNTISNNEVSEEVRETDQYYIDEIRKMIDDADDFYNLVEQMESHDVISANNEYDSGMYEIFTGLKDAQGAYMNNETPEWPDQINVDYITGNIIKEKYWDFRQVDEYKKVWEDLKDAFESQSDKSKDEADKKQNEANDLTNKANEELEKKEETEARDIPSGFGFGNTLSENPVTAKFQNFGKTLGNLAGGKLDDEFTRRFLAFYAIEYDFGMFSSRVTNVEPKGDSEDSGGTDLPQVTEVSTSVNANEIPEDASETSSSSGAAISLTGYEMAKNINYLYGAELEYIIAGWNSSSDNLTTTKTAIWAFREIMNFTSTYTIKEINESISTISKAFNGIPYVGPAVAIAVDIALRICVATVESGCDWSALISGEKVLLYKSELGDLQCIETVKGLLGLDSATGSSGTSDTSGTSTTPDVGDTGGTSGKTKLEIKLGYEDYLFVMMFLFTTPDEIYKRTQNLVELNVNTVSQSIGSSGELSELTFKLENAYTAVKTTCTVDSGFVFMPDSFARSVLGAGSDAYDSLKTFQDNKYSYSVIRGY